MKMKKSYLIILLILFVFVFSQLTTAEDLFPAIIIVYDDGHIEDMEAAYPLHAEMGAPAVSAVNPDTIGVKGHMDVRDLHKLQENGWEIASHGQYHAAMIFNSIKAGIKKGDNKIIVNNPGLIEKRYSYLLINHQNNTSEQIEIKEIKQTKGELILKGAIQNDYQAENTYLRLTEKAMKKEIVGSKQELINLGLDVNAFVYPYNGYTELSQKIVSHNYQMARGGREETQDFPLTFINVPPFNRYRLKGVSFETDQLLKEDLNHLIAETKEQKGLLILYAHTGKEEFSQKRLKYILKTARLLKFNIITFNDLNSYW